MEETWKDIEGFEGKYKISNNGDCFSYFLNRCLKSRITKNSGYLIVNLKINKKQYTYYVHRLVAEAFLEIPEELRHLKGTRYLQVNHKDENKLNNNIENLEWCSHSYNINFGTRNKRISEKNTNGKLSKPILQFTLDGRFVKEWPSVRQAEREGGFNQSHITDCCRGKLKKHKDFIWRYKDEQ